MTGNADLTARLRRHQARQLDAADVGIARLTAERDEALDEVARLRDAQPHKVFVYEKAGWVHVEMVTDEVQPQRWTMPLLTDEALGIARAITDAAQSVLAASEEASDALG